MDLGSFPWNFQRKPIATPRQNRCFLAAPLSGTCQQWWQAWGCHEHFRFLWRSLKLQFSSETLFWYVLRVFSSEFFPVFQVPCPVLMRRRSRRRRKLRHSSKRSRRSRRRRKRNRCKRSKHSSRRKPPRRCHTQHGLATAVLDYFDIISFGLPHQYLAVLYIDHNCLLFVTMIPLQSISITCITISLFILIMGDGWLGDSCNTVYPIYIPIKSHWFQSRGSCRRCRSCRCTDRTWPVPGWTTKWIEATKRFRHYPVLGRGLRSDGYLHSLLKREARSY